MFLLVTFGAYTEYQAENYLAKSKTEHKAAMNVDVQLPCELEAMSRSTMAFCD
jgi:hypothetical protein